MLKKIFLALIALLVLGTAFFFFRFTVLLPRDIPVPDLTIPTDAATIERGRYLANHVAVCMGCHSTSAWQIHQFRGWEFVKESIIISYIASDCLAIKR